MGYAWLLLVGLAALLLGGLAVVQRRPRAPVAYWVGGWISAAIGALLGLPLVDLPGLPLLAFPFSTLCAWFMLAGARSLGGAPLPGAFFVIPLGLGFARSVLAEEAGLAAAYWSGLVTDVPAWLGAALFAQRAVPAQGATFAQRVLAPALVVLAGFAAVAYAWVATGGGLAWAIATGLVTMPGFLGLQFRVAAEWSRRDLERTVAERTSELAAVNASLRASEERYRTVSELGSDVSFGFSVREDGTLTGEWVTEAFEAVTGFGVREMSRERWLGLIHPEDRAAAAQAFHASRGETAGTLAFRIVRKDGAVRWLEARQRVIENGDGFRVLGAARDVTASREAALERRALERRMLEAQRIESLGLVARGVAHDFSNVLTVVLGNLRLALGELPAASPLRARLDRALLAAEHGEELTEQMLVYAGGAPPARKPVALAGLIADMRELLHTVVGERVLLEERLAADVWVEGDETQLRQIVLNLVANAGEAFGGREGCIEVACERVELDADAVRALPGSASLSPGWYAVLTVSDDGPGMDPATQRRIFEPFFSTRLSGRGLGLAAVMGIVRGHEGAIAAESTLGEGTRVRVVLPTARAGEASAARARATVPLGRPRVLVIDDQEPVLELARELLGRSGFAVETALGGRAGLERCEAQLETWDAVVLDLAMPDLDGARVGERVRSLRPDLPLLLVSGFGSDLVREMLAALEPVRFLRKPYGPEALAEAVRALLAGRRSAKEDPAAGR